MSLLMMRGALLAQGGDAAPPVDIGTIWQLDTTRRPSGYTLSNDNQTAINTAGGTNYARWVPTAKSILPTDGRRYWEVLCAPGAVTFDGYMGVVSAAQREDHAGCDQVNRALDGCAADEADGIKQRAQIANVEGGFLAVETDIGQCTPGALFGGAHQQFLELGIGHADMALSGAARGHAERIPTSAGRVALVQALLSAGFSAQDE